jgi:hypothetical protein
MVYDWRQFLPGLVRVRLRADSEKVKAPKPLQVPRFRERSELIFILSEYLKSQFTSCSKDANNETSAEHRSKKISKATAR